jgi:phosphoribosyl 1,2-cyclic phosphodiesterase
LLLQLRVTVRGTTLSSVGRYSITAVREGRIVRFCVLASGSSGNSAWLATDSTRILIDAGLSLRELTRRLAEIGESPERLDAVVITHEHSDHVCGVRLLAKKHCIPVYATRFTAPAIDWGECVPRLQTFQAGASFRIGDIFVNSFTIPHDAADPVGYCFRAGFVKIGVVTDLGYIPESVKFHLRGTDILLLESNHDLEMLKVGPYPWSVKQRVMGRNGHLSNSVMCDFLSEDLDRSTRHLILGHLSEHNNHPEIVRMMATDALEARGLPARLEVATQKQPGTIFQF